MTDLHSRGVRPAQRTRTPSSFISSRRRRMTSRLKPIRKRTSSGDRDQFSVEKAYAETALTPISMAPSTTSNSELSPCSWPLVRGRPRCLAHRPLPSMTTATCRGTSAAGTGGGVAPDGCGLGRRAARFTRRAYGCADRAVRLPLDVRHRAQRPLEMPGEVGRDQRAGLLEVTRLGGLDD